MRGSAAVVCCARVSGYAVNMGCYVFLEPRHLVYRRIHTEQSTIASAIFFNSGQEQDKHEEGSPRQSHMGDSAVNLPGKACSGAVREGCETRGCRCGGHSSRPKATRFVHDQKKYSPLHNEYQKNTRAKRDRRNQANMYPYFLYANGRMTTKVPPFDPQRQAATVTHRKRWRS